MLEKDEMGNWSWNGERVDPRTNCKGSMKHLVQKPPHFEWLNRVKYIYKRVGLDKWLTS